MWLYTQFCRYFDFTFNFGTKKKKLDLMSARFIVKFIFLNFWIEIVFPGWLQWKNLMLWSSSCDSARFPISRVKLYSCKMWNWFLEVSASQYFVHYLSRGHYCYNQQSTAHLLFQFNHILIKYLAKALRGVLYFKKNHISNGCVL